MQVVQVKRGNWLATKMYFELFLFLEKDQKGMFQMTKSLKSTCTRALAPPQNTRISKADVIRKDCGAASHRGHGIRDNLLLFAISRELSS